MKANTLEEKARKVAARKAELGGITDEQIAAARNRGGRRTPEKRALLAYLAEEAEWQGRALPFPSNCSLTPQQSRRGLRLRTPKT